VTKLKGLIAFAILMESNVGIIGKSPVYVREKFELTQTLEDPSQALDRDNKAKYEDYLKGWKL